MSKGIRNMQKMQQSQKVPKNVFLFFSLVSAFVQKKKDFKIIKQKKYTYIHTQIQLEISIWVVLQSGYIFAEDLNVINKNINGIVHKWYCAILKVSSSTTYRYKENVLSPL